MATPAQLNGCRAFLHEGTSKMTFLNAGTGMPPTTNITMQRDDISYQLNSFQYMQVNGGDTHKWPPEGALRKNSPWMSVEASAWSVKSCTFFMSGGKDRSGRFSARCTPKGSEGHRKRQHYCRAEDTAWHRIVGTEMHAVLPWRWYQHSRGKDLQGKLPARGGPAPPSLDCMANRNQGWLLRLLRKENRLQFRW